MVGDLIYHVSCGSALGPVFCALRVCKIMGLAFLLTLFSGLVS